MKKLIIILLSFFSVNLIAQTIEGVDNVILRTQAGDYQVAESGDSLYARYADILFAYDHAGTAISIELNDISDTASVQLLTSGNYTVPANNTDNGGLYSLDKAGNTISIYMGRLSLLHRYRLKLWIANSVEPVYITEF